MKSIRCAFRACRPLLCITALLLHSLALHPLTLGCAPTASDPKAAKQALDLNKLGGANAAFRGSILHFLRDPGLDVGGLEVDDLDVDPTAYEYLEDGILVVRGGRIESVEEATDALWDSIKTGRNVEEAHNHKGKLIVPGFIDTHTHYPQSIMIARAGYELLDWLDNYTFETESAFGNYDFARDVAETFLNTILSYGTTTALVFCTVHRKSVEAFFDAAQQRKLRMIAGKVMMDRNAIDCLHDTADTSYGESNKLLRKWHETDRLLYAVTPRFAITSTSEQLKKAQQLLEENPSAYLHTHLAENPGEVEYVSALFGRDKSYLGHYEGYGFVRPKAVFAHSIHLEEGDYSKLADAQAAVSFCPGSNLFLGSGFFDLRRTVNENVRVGLGTDIGAGTTFSVLKTGGDAYKVGQALKSPMAPLYALYLATLGGAHALHLDDTIGNFAKGKEADLVVLNLDSPSEIVPSIESVRRKRETQRDTYSQHKALSDIFSTLMFFSDKSTVEATYILGNKVETNVTWEPNSQTDG